ncbi:GGDEF domain-containing protein [Actinoplanes palleronii]|uniref:GGDEF domain-containing protein n=1 Tax=Actinoplanes palleronii TaxID=113570 RepID=A0ABQ4BRM0_9ACTN|nr:GGDEF domain-containing protein [Actinoplanes palleronii]GIE72941.1 hypothetical protein Apa02nite_090490 [Actinoplanes palleronii]
MADLDAMALVLDEYEDALTFDVDAAGRQAAAIEDAAGATELGWRARLLRADVIERRGELAVAARTLSEILDWATLHECRRVVARTHRILARLYRAMGDLAANLDHMLQCVTALDDTTPVSGRIACVIKLADAYAETGSMPAARERYEQAVALAQANGSTRRLLMALNNYAYAEYDRGEPELSRAVLARLRSAGGTLDFSALDTVARVESLLGEHHAAETAAREALRAYDTDSADEADALADLLLTLAFVQRRAGDRTAAQGSLDKVRELCAERSLVLVGVQARLEQAELYADGADFERAYHALRDFQDAQERLRSAQRDAQARNRQALFEVAEARRQAEWFREQAYRDPLTGLRNRRYVDEHLPPLLRRAAAEGSPVTVAMLDLDHFKRINDTLSHEAGDRVLVAVAGLLAGFHPGVRDAAGFAARLGGEEFLLVVTGVGVAEAAFRLDELRQAVGGHPWRPVTGELPVTVSVGVSATVTEITQVALLARADAALYQAKHDGRDRLCLDPDVSVPQRRRVRDLI